MKLLISSFIVAIFLIAPFGYVDAQCIDEVTGKDVPCRVDGGGSPDPAIDASGSPDPAIDASGSPDPEQNQTGNSGGGSVTINNPLKANSITELFIDLIEVVLVFATPIIVFFIIYAGFLYVTARGNPEQITQANRALLYAVIGGVLILGAFVILSVIQGTVDAVTI